MPNTVQKQGKKFRVIDKDTGQVTKNVQGNPVDGGGFISKTQAQAQATAINISQYNDRHPNKQIKGK